METDDPAEAEAVYEDLCARRFHAVAIFDANGEGEPLDPEQMWERIQPARVPTEAEIEDARREEREAHLSRRGPAPWL